MMTFFLTDEMTFKEPVLLLRNENISGPAGMALNCASLFSNSWARPYWAMPRVSANPRYVPATTAGVKEKERYKVPGHIEEPRSYKIFL